MNKFMQQAQKIQEQIKKTQEEKKNIVVEGKSGAGMVTVKMTGTHYVDKVNVDKSLFSEDKDVIEDLVAAAINDAVRMIEEQSKSDLSDLASGLNLPPGFKFPF